jgi:hypothetical protein
MRLQIGGVGLWGPGMQSWQDFLAGQADDYAKTLENPPTPTPRSIPARERRRAPLPVKLAVEVIEQACEMGSIEPGNVATIFSSAMGDNEITNYICSTLLGPEKLLSPTRFHNSVHNAASGYWSIAAQNRAPSGYVGAFEDSLAIAVLEAATLCVAEERPVVLAIYDVPTVAPLSDICRIEQPFGAAFVLDSCDGTESWSVEVDCCKGVAQQPRLRNPGLQRICDINPAAQSLAILEAMTASGPTTLRWPIGNATHLEMRLSSQAGT